MTKATHIHFIIFALIFMMFINVNVALANGGDQRVVDNKYFINLSRAPFTPRVGVKTAFLASFVDISKDKLISEDLIVRVRIVKQGESLGKPLFEQDNIQVHGGVLELPYTFIESGLHEIFFDFIFTSNPQKLYEVPDFLIDVQKSSTENITDTKSLLLGISMGVVAGLLGGWFVSRKKS